MRGQDLTDLEEELRVLSCDRHTHSCLPPLQIQRDNTAKQFCPPVILILKPISANDLALVGDELKSAEARGNQINFSLVLVTQFKERAAEGSQ